MILSMKLSPHNANNDVDVALTSEDLIRIIESNRTRLRSLSGMIVTICGILLSTSFVTLFFILKENLNSTPRIVPILILFSFLTLMSSIIFSLLSSLLPTPSSSTSKFELVDVSSRIYYREYRRSIVAITLLLVSIVLLTASMSVFAVAVLF